MRIDGKIIAGKIEFSGINNHKRLNGADARTYWKAQDQILLWFIHVPKFSKNGNE